MAKKSKKNTQATQTKEYKPTQSSRQNSENTKAKSLAKIIGCLCLMAFIFFEELWVGTLAGALSFAAFFVLQVFIEKSREWYTSGYLYATIGCAVLAYLEYQYHIISNLMGL